MKNTATESNHGDAMPDQTNLVQSIYSAIFNGVGSSGASDSSNYLSLEWPGLPVSEADYGNPWSASNTNGNQQSEENFSVLVDTVPNLSPIYEPSGVGVESVYSMILMATVGTASPSPAIAQQFADAQQLFANSEIGAASNPASLYHPSYSMPADWTSATSAGWTKITVSLGGAPAATPPPPQRVTDTINKALLTQSNAVGWRSAAVDVAAVKKIGVTVLPTTFKGPVLTKAPVGGTQVRPVAMVAAAHAPVAAVAAPTAATASAASISPTMLASINRMVQVRSVSEILIKPRTTTETLAPGLISRLQLNNAATAAPTHFIRPIAVGPIATQPVQSKPVTSSSLNLTMSCQRVTIRRDWMNPLVLQLGDWSIDGVPAGTLSTGTTDSTNTGPFALVPLSFIVVRDVSISGTWSADDKSFAMQASSPGNVVAFGPLTLANAAASQSTFDGATLTVPGMQIVAWNCHPTPKLPPL
jgi:hypothetical protein